MRDVPRLNTATLSRALSLVLLVALGVAAAAAAADLVIRFWIQAHASIYGDASAYFIEGRSVLNGLVPYRDGLDNKPPGIFLIAAASLLITGDERFGFVLQLLVIGALPVILTTIALRVARNARWHARLLCVAAAVIVGAALAAYELERAGGFQCESFGVCAAALYLLVITWDRTRMTRLRTVLAALFLLCSFGIKEPFVFTTLAAVLLLARDWRFFRSAFLVPLLSALLTGTILLLLFGYLGPYLHIDLPLVLGDRLKGDCSATIRSPL
jgi:hypothetical protein